MANVGNGIKFKSKEYYELLDQFERDFDYLRLDREETAETWKRGYVYQNGETNNLFRAYINGYSFAKSVFIQ